MRIHEIDLDGYEARWSESNSKRGPSLATWGSFGLERLHLNQGEGWQGMTVTATFLLGDNEKTMVADADGMVDVPPQALAEAGNGVIVFSGDMAGAQRITADIRYKVIDHSEVRGDVPEPTPDAFHQYIEQTNQYREEAAASAASAAASAQQAAESADGAAGSAEKAGEYADNAYASANVAALQATNAKNSAAAAADSAEAAAASAAEAAGSEASVAADAEAARQAASAAAASETAAASSASAAKTSETNAASSKTAAASSASAAKTSETNAASSKTAAANSATAAASSAGEAADSAAAAADSAAAAAASAAEAAGSEASVAADAEAARQAASAAAASETAAASSASAAKTSETNAASSKTAAASSASAAKTSETNAASSKTAAANSATAAASSAGEAADSAAAAADSAAAAAASAAEAEGITTYQHRKLGTEHHLIGKGPDGKAQMTADVDTGDTVVLHDCADVDGLVIEGKTTQAGTGDPSPENIRPISGVGMYDQRVVLDGAPDETWNAFQGFPGVFYHDFVPQADDTYNADYIKTNSKKYNPKASNEALKIGEFITQKPLNSTRFVIRYDSSSKDPKDIKDYLSAHPLTVWYRSVNYTKSTGPFYTVVELSDDPYRAVGFELTQPLFDGDTLQVGVPSGCDRMIVLDGNEFTNGNSDAGWSYSLPSYTNYDGNGGGVVASNYFSSTNGYISKGAPNNVIGINNEGRLILKSTEYGDDYTALNAWIAEMYSAGAPLIVFYRSTEYTEKADIPAAIEKHTGNYLIFDGTETVTVTTSGSNTPYLQIADVADGYNSSHRLVSSVAPFAYAYGGAGAFADYDNIVFGKAWCQSNGFANTETMVKDFKSFLTAQHTAGTPVQVVYELAAPVEYARLYDGTTLPAYMGTEDFGAALDGEPVSGKWLTFTQDGTQVNFKGGGLSGSKLAAADAEPGDVRTGKKFYAGDKTIKTGTLPVRRTGKSHQISRYQNSMTKEVFIQANTIPEGIYESDGNTWYPQINIPAELFGNAAASQVLAGVTFTSENGAKVAGTMTNRPGHQESKIAFGNGTGSIIVPIPKGAYLNNGESRPDNYDNSQNSSIAFLAGTATPDKVLTGNRFCSAHGVNIAGTMPNQGAKTAALNAGGSYTIPQGWHNGKGKVTANSLASQTSANAENGDIISGKTAWVNGSKRTGTLQDLGYEPKGTGCTLHNGGVYIYFGDSSSRYALSRSVWYPQGDIKNILSFGGSGSSGDKFGNYAEIYRNESNWTREIQARSHASASISGKTVTITVHAEAYQRANDIPSLSGTKSSVDYSFSFNIG